MQIDSSSRPLRRSGIAAPPASMYRLASASRHLRSFIASATPRWWPPALARRVPPRFAAANPPARHDSRFPHGSRNMASSSGLKGKDLGKPEHGSVELYGYIAARDRLEPLLNYVVNFSRDDPIIVEQGSLINMAGPKRGIQLVDTTLIEYDMKIKTGKHEDEDLQLIDGVSFIDDMETCDRHVYTCRLRGDGGVVNLALSRLKHAVQATVEVAISQVRGKLIMQLGCFTSEIDEEIRIFDGAVVGSHGLRSSAVAVALDDHLDLRFKVAAEPCVPPAEHCCSFKASKHGHATEEIETGFALITVKVTWSTLVRA
ncbi:hypothetical protein U9M48_025834 [Paspalum notatum var. saurae]|uniref:DUF6598 domain-containing protein n=1 Tax=Paspalum notatum var. saurae TaxID=547442 RepID=A0AAQ3TTE4_PASNO